MFSYVSKPSSLAEEMEELAGPKYERALGIYKKLEAARGDQRYPAPPFLMSKRKQYGAYLAPGSSSIVLEEEAYDICMSFGEKEGEAALAGLLGHELIHFYEKHQWRTGFARAYNELEIGRTLEKMINLDKINNETQSDYLGGFLAYSAGYEVFKQRAKLLDKIYEDYPVPPVDTTGRYPSLADRKALAVKSEEKLEELVLMFEMANVLAVIGAYDNARAFYWHILIDYQSPQLYSNLGVVTVLEALELFPKSERAYRLPLELDLSFGAGGKDGFTEKDLEQRRELLQTAIGYFNSAIGLNRAYAPAYLNLACAYYLLGQPERAQFYAEVEAQAYPDAYPKTAIDARALLALLQLDAGDKDAAIATLEPIIGYSATARYNLRKMKGESSQGPEVEEPDAYEIDDLKPRDLTLFPRGAGSGTLDIRLYDKLRFEVWENTNGLQNSKVMRIRPPEGPEIFVHLTGQGYEGETYDYFKIGTDRSEIVDKYNEPEITRELPKGEILVYKEVLFFLDENGKLERWANYVFD